MTEQTVSDSFLQSVVDKVKDKLDTINWKYVFIGVGISFIIFPYPYLKLCKPLIQRIGKTYNKILQQNIKQIVLASSETPIEEIMNKIRVKNNEIQLLNYQDVCKADEEGLCQIWGHTIHSRLRTFNCPYVIILSNPRIIQNVEMRFYNMQQPERYKLELVTEKSFHTINHQSKIFRLEIISIDEL